MEILIALGVLLLLYFGLKNRKKEKKEWIKEERYEDNAEWLDRRPGERGTFGKFDVEMENERRDLRKQVKINGLVQVFRNYLAENYPAYQNIHEEKWREKLPFLKNESAEFVRLAEKMENGFEPSALEFLPGQQPKKHPLKKLVLDFSFENFPKLLNLEIEVIKKFDLMAERLVLKVLAELVQT